MAFLCQVCLDRKAKDEERRAACGCGYRFCVSCESRVRGFLLRAAYNHRLESYPCPERKGRRTPHPQGVVGDLTEDGSSNDATGGGEDHSSNDFTGGGEGSP